MNSGIQHDLFYHLTLSIQVLKTMRLISNCVPLAPSVSFFSILFILVKAPMLSEQSFHIFSYFLQLFPVEYYLNPILLLSNITDLILPLSVISIASFTSVGTWGHSEKSGVFFSAVKQSVWFSTLSLLPRLQGLLGTFELFLEKILYHLYFYIYCMGSHFQHRGEMVKW